MRMNQLHYVWKETKNRQGQDSILNQTPTQDQDKTASHYSHPGQPQAKTDTLIWGSESWSWSEHKKDWAGGRAFPPPPAYIPDILVG